MYNKIYDSFFELRKNYSKHINLISEIMKYYFKNNDSFETLFCLDGKFSEKDVKFIFQELNLKVKKSYSAFLHSKNVTYVELEK